MSFKVNERVRVKLTSPAYPGMKGVVTKIVVMADSREELIYVQDPEGHISPWSVANLELDHEALDVLRTALGVIGTYATDEWSRKAAKLALEGGIITRDNPGRCGGEEPTYACACTWKLEVVNHPATLEACAMHMEWARNHGPRSKSWVSFDVSGVATRLRTIAIYYADRPQGPSLPEYTTVDGLRLAADIIEGIANPVIPIRVAVVGERILFQESDDADPEEYVITEVVKRGVLVRLKSIGRETLIPWADCQSAIDGARLVGG